MSFFNKNIEDSKKEIKEKFESRKSKKWSIREDVLYIVVILLVVTAGVSYSKYVAYKKAQPAIVALQEDYYDQFVDLVKDSYPNLRNASDAYMREQFNNWINRISYNNIEVKDGKLINVNVQREYPLKINGIKNGVYLLYDRGYSYVANIDFLNGSREEGYIAIAGLQDPETDDDNQDNYVSSRFTLKDGKYRLTDVGLYFYTDRNTNSLVIVDNYTDGKSFSGNYKLIYLYNIND